jgi:hypothetical protein
VAAIELLLTLDRDPAEYRGGETVEGSVEMYVQERCECRALSVSVVWVARGPRLTDQGQIPEVTLRSGTFDPGQRQTHRFAIALPPAIWTYEGQTFSLSYEAHAKADLANAADVHARAPILVRPAERIAPGDLNPDLGVILPPAPDLPPILQQAVQGDQVAARFQPGCMIVSGIFSILVSIPFMVGSYLLYGTLMPLMREAGLVAVIPVVAWMILGIGIPIVTGTVMLYTGLRPFLARWQLGTVSVDIPDGLVAPGGAINCRISFQPRRDVDILRVQLTLRARETVWRRTKNSRRSTHRPIRSEARTLEGARSARAGDYVELTGRIDVPAEGPYSLGAPNHWVVWHVIVHISLKGWIDHYSEHPVTVAPITAAVDD